MVKFTARQLRGSIMFSLTLSIYLIMASYVEEDNKVLKFYIDDAHISGYRKSSFTPQLSSQCVIVNRIPKLTLYKQLESLLKQFNQLLIWGNSLLKMLFKRFVALDLLHTYRSFMKSSTVLKGPDKL